MATSEERLIAGSDFGGCALGTCRVAAAEFARCADLVRADLDADSAENRLVLRREVWFIK